MTHLGSSPLELEPEPPRVEPHEVRAGPAEVRQVRWERRADGDLVEADDRRRARREQRGDLQPLLVELAREHAGALREHVAQRPLEIEPGRQAARARASSMSSVLT